MRKFQAILIVWSGCLLLGVTRAEEFQLSNGSVLKGETASFNGEGMVVKQEVGGFSQRIPWSQFTEETLKRIAKNPKAAEFVEPFIEPPPDLKAKRTEIILKPVPRLEPLPGKPGLVAALTTPAGVVILVVLLLANIFAGYEIAVYRKRPAAVVCAVSTLLPLIGPIIFLALPPPEEVVSDPETIKLPGAQFDAAHAGAAPGVPAAESDASLTGRLKSKITSLLHKRPAGGLAVAAQDKAAPPSATEGPRIFRRGEFTFNRRFFETQFPGFFRVVPSEAEKNLLLVIKAGRQDYIGRRISRITANEMHLQVQSGGEVSIEFAGVTEVQVRHKDAKV